LGLNKWSYSWFFLLVLALSFFSRCNTNPYNVNYSHLYSGTESILKPDYIIYHHQDDSSQVYFNINSEELLYVRKDKSEPYNASVLVHYRLYSGIDSKIILDSASRKIEDITDEKSTKSILGNFSISVPMGGKYFLKLLTTDLNRGSIDEAHLLVDKRKTSGSQFFLLKKLPEEVALFTNYIVNDNEFVVESKMNKNSDFQGRFYNRKFPLATPPFSAAISKPFKYYPDSIAVYSLNAEGRMNFTVQDSGFVQFQTDTSSRAGYTLFRQPAGFPLIKTTEEMFYPLRYICTKNEYNSFLLSSDLKKSIDKFWINKTGSKERGRELIKKYYNRVQTANQYFTSYIEGWKTDRGMISLIFGAPKVVNKSNDTETWIYGEETNTLSLRFTFDKVNNPFTNNDYKLIRGPGYRTHWYRAVDAWRSGRVYWVN